jgi:hypothetical protein
MGTSVMLKGLQKTGSVMMMSNCGKCDKEIQIDDLYVEAKRHGVHDTYRVTYGGHQIHDVPIPIHVTCPT